jgi:TonB family protein
MRNAVVALLSLSSCMLTAQAATPAQTQDASNGTVQVRRVSTGVTAPRLIRKVDVVADSPEAARVLSADCKVVVSMIVDKTGKPSDLRIVQSASPSLDASVLAAVSQYRFAPGTVSNEPVATPLNLEVLITNNYR